MTDHETLNGINQLVLPSAIRMLHGLFLKKLPPWTVKHPQKLLFTFVLFMFFFFFSTVLFSQSYLVHHYTEMEGLPTANVSGIIRDHWGRIWFATRGGITVYDGTSRETYTVSDGLPVLPFYNIQTDQKGRIWALSDVLFKGPVKEGYVKDYEITIKRKDGVPRSCLVTAALVLEEK